TPHGPAWLTSGDLNGDTRTDAVVSCGQSGTVEVMLQARPLTSSFEGAYTFSLPGGVGAVQLTRGPELQSMDWQYLTPMSVDAGFPPMDGGTLVSITLPAISTLAGPPPAPPAPPGQIVGWSVQGYKGNVDLNNFRFGLLRADDQVQAGASVYI